MASPRELRESPFPEPVPIFAAWRPNNENEANVAIEALLAGDLKVTDVLLGDETFGGGLFPYLYEEAGGWVLSPKQLPQERRSWKDDLYDYRKETIELLFQRIIQALGLKECQVKGEGRNGAFVLTSVWLYQICYLTNYREGKPLVYIKIIWIAILDAYQIVDHTRLIYKRFNYLHYQTRSGRS